MVSCILFNHISNLFQIKNQKLKNSCLTLKIYVLTSIRQFKARVRTKTVKKASKVLIERYYTRLTLDFHTNKRICEEVAIIPSKKLRNKIAG